MDHTVDERVYGSIVREITLLRVLAILLAAKAILIVASYEDARRQRRKRRRAVCPFFKRIIYSNDTDCHDQIRMTRGAFFKLANILRERGTIKDTINMKLEEQLVMFLHTLGHNLRNRKIGHNFGHSGETVSRHFHMVLKAIILLHSSYFLPPSITTSPEILGKDRFDPYFKVNLLDSRTFLLEYIVTYLTIIFLMF